MENDNTTIQDSRKAAMNFLRLGRKKNRKQEAAKKAESAIEIAQRIHDMSDDEFNAAVANGTLTPEQIRKAGEYDFDVYMGDVWIENPDNDDKPEPSYEEFMSDPAKYGYDVNEDYHKFSRYNPNRYKMQ